MQAISLTFDIKFIFSNWMLPISLINMAKGIKYPLLTFIWLFHIIFVYHKIIRCIKKKSTTVLASISIQNYIRVACSNKYVMIATYRGLCVCMGSRKLSVCVSAWARSGLRSILSMVSPIRNTTHWLDFLLFQFKYVLMHIFLYLIEKF